MTSVYFFNVEFFYLAAATIPSNFFFMFTALPASRVRDRALRDARKARELVGVLAYFVNAPSSFFLGDALTPLYRFNENTYYRVNALSACAARECSGDPAGLCAHYDDLYMLLQHLLFLAAVRQVKCLCRYENIFYGNFAQLYVPVGARRIFIYV